MPSLPSATHLYTSKHSFSAVGNAAQNRTKRQRG
jgi:hypothetical protein